MIYKCWKSTIALPGTNRTFVPGTVHCIKVTCRSTREWLLYSDSSTVNRTEYSEYDCSPLYLSSITWNKRTKQDREKK